LQSIIDKNWFAERKTENDSWKKIL
jgi:hypothetical protein